MITSWPCRLQTFVTNLYNVQLGRGCCWEDSSRLDGRWTTRITCQLTAVRLATLIECDTNTVPGSSEMILYKHECTIEVVTFQCSKFGSCGCFRLPSSGHHLSYDDRLEDKRENYQNCSVLCCVRQLCTMIHTHTYEQFLKSVFGFCAFV